MPRGFVTSNMGKALPIALKKLTMVLVALLITGAPSTAQQPITPIKPSAEPGWIFADRWCAGPPPRAELCEPSRAHKQHWYWVKILPKRGSSKSRGAYMTEITYARWKPERYDPTTTSVNCETWEAYAHYSGLEPEWKPIKPGSNGDWFAEMACKAP